MRLFFVIVLSLLVISSASAATVVFQIPLDPGQESPAPAGADNSTGQATVSLDLDASTVTVAGSYENMSSNVVAAHIHGLAGVGENAGVIVPLDTSGGTSGTVSGSGALSADDLQGVLDGRTYVNIHTQNNGPGEIRGQIMRGFKVPLVSLLGVFVFLSALLGGGILALRRRRDPSD